MVVDARVKVTLWELVNGKRLQLIASYH